MRRVASIVPPAAAAARGVASLLSSHLPRSFAGVPACTAGGARAGREWVKHALGLAVASGVAAWGTGAECKASREEAASHAHHASAPALHRPAVHAMVAHANDDEYGLRSHSELHPRLRVLNSRAVRCLLTTLRDVNTNHTGFIAAGDRLMRILAEEGLASVPDVVEKTVVTPCGVYRGLATPPDRELAAVSIVRSGDALLEAVRRIAPGVGVGKILIQRDETTVDKTPKLFYVKLPHDISSRTVLLVDPMLATGGSAIMAIEELIRRGVPEERIVFLNVVACPEGLARMATVYPRVTIVTTAIDENLNSDMYIVPGLGDFGDRYFDTLE